MIDVSPMTRAFAQLPSDRLASMMYQCQAANTQEEKEKIYNEAMIFLDSLNNEKKKRTWQEIFKKRCNLPIDN